MWKRLLALAGIAAGIAAPCLHLPPARPFWQRDPRASHPLFRFARNDKVGFLDATGRVAIPAQFDVRTSDVSDFVEGLARLIRNDRWVYIDPTGRVAIETQFDRQWTLDNFSGGFARVLSPDFNKGYGFIDKSGALAIPLQFENAADFSEGLAAFQSGSSRSLLTSPRSEAQVGYIDTTGAVVIPPRFGSGGPFREGLARVALDGNCWFEGTGGPVAGLSESAADSCGRLAPEAALPCLQGYIDKSGSFVMPPRFTGATDFSESLAAVRTGTAWGYIDRTGAAIVSPRFESALPFSEGLAAVKEHGVWGYIDRKGATVVAPFYDEAASFSDGLALVRKNRALQYVDHQGQSVLGAPLSEAGSFAFGLAAGREARGRFAYFDKTGRILLRFTAFDPVFVTPVR